MSRLDCEIIRDLIPLCVEDMASEKSKNAVKEHIELCEDCNKIYSSSKEPDIAIKNIESAKPLKDIKKKYRKHTASIIIWSVFITLAIGILMWGKFWLQPGDEMGYCILTFYFLMPLTALPCSIAVAFQKSVLKWFTPLLFGAIGGIVPYLIFNSTDWIFVFFAFVPSLIGFIIGMIIKVATKKS